MCVKEMRKHKLFTPDSVAGFCWGVLWKGDVGSEVLK